MRAVRYEARQCNCDSTHWMVVRVSAEVCHECGHETNTTEEKYVETCTAVPVLRRRGVAEQVATALNCRMDQGVGL